MRKKIICLETGIIYNGLTEAEQILGISLKQISKCLRNLLGLYFLDIIAYLRLGK